MILCGKMYTRGLDTTKNKRFARRIQMLTCHLSDLIWAAEQVYERV